VKKFEHDERVSRQRAAERLVDIAYALAGGGELELRAEGAQVSVPVADDVLLKRVSRSDGDRVEVEVVLSWSA
jgi:amphi-Trp domain-containing protein